MRIEELAKKWETEATGEDALFEYRVPLPLEDAAQLEALKEHRRHNHIGNQKLMELLHAPGVQECSLLVRLQSFFRRKVRVHSHTYRKHN